MALDLADRIGAEIVSVDSMQVYRGMDIGTAKPSADDRRRIAHHMVDVVDPSEEFSVAEFQRTARQIVAGASAPILITGGSGLHFRAVVDPMTFAPTDSSVREALEAEDLASLSARLLDADPEAGVHVDLANKRRLVRALEVFEITGQRPSERASTPEARKLRDFIPEFEFTAVGFDPGDLLERRIEARLTAMVGDGLVSEVEGLWPKMGRNARGAVGYREIGSSLDGSMDLDEALRETERATKRLARRQRTWFQRDPRIQWIPWSDDHEARLARVMEVLV